MECVFFLFTSVLGANCKSKILNQILVKMLKFSIVPEYKGKSIVEIIEHFLHGKLDNTKIKTLVEYKGMSPNSGCVTST